MLPGLALASLPVLIAVMPPTPRSVGLTEAAYAVLAVGLVVRTGVRIVSGASRLPPRLLWLPVGALLTYLLMSVSWALTGGVPLGAWLQGVAPFSGLLLVAPAYDIASDERARRLVLGGVLAGAALVYAQIFWSAAMAIPTAVAAGTALVIRNLLPAQAYAAIGLAGAGFLLGRLAAPGGESRLWVAAAGIAVVALFLTFLRIFAVIVVLLIVAAALVRLAPRVRLGKVRWWRVAVMTGAVALTIGLLIQLPPIAGALDAVFGGYVDRFGQLLGDGTSNTRLAETAAVLDHWQRSPLLGNAPGYRYAYMRPELGLVWQGAYTHNVFTYMLLTGGVAGTALMAWVYGAVLWSTRVLAQGPTVIGIGLAIMALLAYALFQATFRTVGFWPTLAVLIALQLQLARHSGRDTTRGGSG
jgi:hypothetical protein